MCVCFLGLLDNINRRGGPTDVVLGCERNGSEAGS